MDDVNTEPSPAPLLPENTVPFVSILDPIPEFGRHEKKLKFLIAMTEKTTKRSSRQFILGAWNEISVNNHRVN
jgi:hypothetical protein